MSDDGRRDCPEEGGLRMSADSPAIRSDRRAGIESKAEGELLYKGGQGMGAGSDERSPSSTSCPAQAEVPRAPFYPYYVTGDADRHRFDLAHWVAINVIGAAPGTGHAWLAARSLFAGDLPTD
jgi:hypothetical protein